MLLLAINLMFWCCNDEALESDDNAIKTVNLCVKSLLTVNYQTYFFSNKPKLFQHPRQMYSKAVMPFD